jgi:AcrR family transcriptional regulator
VAKGERSKAPADKTRRRPRGSLNASEIVDAAFRIVVAEGLDALSMPALARELGAGVTSIYWYFRSKDDLLAALGDRVTEEVFGGLPPLADGPAEDELERHFVALRDQLRRLPAYVELCTLRPWTAAGVSVPPAIAVRLEQVVALLGSLGLPPNEADCLHLALSSYTRGFVLLEAGLAHEQQDEADGVGAALAATVHRLDPTDYPTLSQLGELEPAMALGDEEFARGLRLLLAGIDGGGRGRRGKPATRSPGPSAGREPARR